MRTTTNGPKRLGRARIGLVTLGIGGLLLLGGCHGHGHYYHHSGGHGCHSYHGHRYSGDADVFAGLAVLFFGLWALCS